MCPNICKLAVLMAAAGLAGAAPTCDDLTKLELAHATITTAQAQAAARVIG